MRNVPAMYTVINNFDTRRLTFKSESHSGLVGFSRLRSGSVLPIDRGRGVNTVKSDGLIYILFIRQTNGFAACAGFVNVLVARQF